MLGKARHVHPADENTPGIHRPHARHRIQQRGFARPVAAYNGDEIALVQLQAQPAQGFFLIDGARVERFINILHLKHAHRPLSFCLCRAL